MATNDWTKKDNEAVAAALADLLYKPERNYDWVWGLMLFVILIPAMIVNGFVFQQLWALFVIPTFPAAPQIGIAASIGLMIVANWAIKPSTASYEKKDGETYGKYFARMFGKTILAPFITLAIGYLVSHWM